MKPLRELLSESLYNEGDEYTSDARIKSLEAEIENLVRIRDRQSRGSEARKTYSDRVKRAREQLRSAKAKNKKLKNEGHSPSATQLRSLIRTIITERRRIREQDEEEAKKRLDTIEDKYGSSWEDKLDAFQWADDPEAALADLMRKAGRDPKKD